MKVRELESIGLDRRIIDEFEKGGASELYPPQADAAGPAIRGENLVLSIPTASGKTLIAYIAMLNRALRGEKSLYIVPLRALAREKYEELLKFKSMGIRVGITTGDYDKTEPYLGRNHIIVCTSEKADSMLRHGTGWLKKLRVVVADEVHLMNDPSRGPTMEVILTRFKAVNPDAQLIALSATISNAKEVADWLGAKLVCSSWRPVKLKEGICDGKKVEFMDGTEIEIDPENREDEMSFLVKDTIRDSGQVLVFSNTRKSAVSLAKRLSPGIENLLSDREKERVKELSDQVSKRDHEHTTLGNELASCLRCGAAFHHAGLSSEHRRIVEKGFLDRKIKCIVATPTLAAGINLPARRVIIRNLWRYQSLRGLSPLPNLEIQQMMGRAGRPGLDPYGEAILLAKNEIEKEKVKEEYLLSDVEPISSKLGTEPALRVHLLSTIAGGFAKTLPEIQHFFGSTFFAHSAESYWIEERLEEVLDFLVDKEFIFQESGEYKPTRFGEKTSQLYVDPLTALRFREALLGERVQNAEPFSFLHLLCYTPDMRLLFLGKTDDWVWQKLERYDKFLLEKPAFDSPDIEMWAYAVKTSLLIEDWIDERSEESISKRFGVGPGDIHAEAELAKWLCYALREFARLFYLPNILTPLTKLLLRIENGCKEELLQLIQLEGIGRIRARNLWNTGFKNFQTLRKAPPKVIAEVPGIGMEIAMSIKKQVSRLDETQFNLEWGLD
jgi:helicase